LGSSLKLEKQLKYADKMGAKFAVIVGETEMQSQSVIVKDLTQKTQKNVAISELARELCS
jgi:histidyl-tRNA synthetase